MGWVRRKGGSRIGDFRYLGKEFGYAIKPCHRFLNLFPGHAKGANRLVEHFQVEEESDQVGYRQSALKRHPPTKIDNDELTQRRRKIDKGLEDRHQTQSIHQGTPVPFDTHFHPFVLIAFTIECFDFSDSGNAIIENGK